MMYLICHVTYIYIIIMYVYSMYKLKLCIV